MNLRLTDHAKEQIAVRIGCSERKMPKLLAKAWRSVEPIQDKELSNVRWYRETYGECEYRKLMGMIWVFAADNLDTECLAVVTVKPPAPVNAFRSKPAQS